MPHRSVFCLLLILVCVPMACLSSTTLDYGNSRYGSTLEDLRRFTFCDGRGEDTILELWSHLPLKVSIPDYAWTHFGDEIEYEDILWDAVERLETAVSEIVGVGTDLYEPAPSQSSADLDVDYIHPMTWAQFEDIDWQRDGAPRRASLHIRYFTTKDTTDLLDEIEHALIWLLIGGDGHLPWPNTTRRFRTQTTDLSNMDIINAAPTAAEYEMVALALELGTGTNLSNLDCGRNLAPRLVVQTPDSAIKPWQVVGIDLSGTNDPEGSDVALELRQVQGYAEAAIAADLYQEGLFWIQLPATGDYVFEATATDADDNASSQRIHLYALGECPPPEPVEVRDGLIVGAHYISIWGRKNFDWRTGTENVGDRTVDFTLGSLRYRPLLGNYECADPTIADWHIKMAIENGVNCFIIPNTRPAAGWAVEKNLEEGFLQSQYLDQISFCMELNLGSWWESGGRFAGISIDAVVEETIAYYCDNYFDHPSYLWIDDRPVLMVYREQVHLGAVGSAERDRFLNLIRSVASSKGYDLYLIGDVLDNNYDTGWMSSNVGPFDAASAYWTTGFPWTHSNGSPYVDLTYDSNAASVIEQFGIYTEFLGGSETILMPAIATGFDNTPAFEIGIDNWLRRLSVATPTQFADYAELALDYVNAEAPMLVIYAWNENHEGGVLEPTHEMGYGYLEALREVVAVEPASGWPENSLTLAGEPAEILDPGSNTSILLGADSEAGENDAGEINTELPENSFPIEETAESQYRLVAPSDIFWLASFDDESGRTESNYADIIQGSNGYGEYYAMEWDSPEDTDLTIGSLDDQDRTGVIGIKLSLSASGRMDVLPVVSVSGDYCGRTWRFATAELISVSEEREDFFLSVSEFNDDPFMGCVGSLPDDALELIDSIILFPEDRAGQLRVYEVGLCKEPSEQASAEPYIESQADEDTQAPDDREPEDVVNTECSSNPPLRIAFHPERPEIKPGETVRWTIEIPEEMLPLHAKIEFDNDQNYDMELDLTECRTLLQFVYEEANVYAPFLVYQDVSSMAEHKVYSDEVIGVLPELESREGLGIRIATQESPISTYMKGFNIAGIDGELFETDSGRAWIRGELQQIGDLGANMVMYNIHWFADDVSSSLQEPIYYGAWPDYHQDTITVTNLIDLVDWSHGLGLRVGFRPLLTIKGNYDSTLRAKYSPNEQDMYIEQQSQMKAFYAELANTLGVELFDLAAEETAFTLHPRGGEVADAVSEAMGGSVSLAPAENSGDVYRCPYLDALDLIGCTDYVLDNGDFEGIPFSVLSELAQYHFQEEFEQLLLQYTTPGYLGELGVNLQKHGYSEAARRAEAYLKALQELSTAGSPIVGVLWWDWVLSRSVVGPHSVKGTILESVIREYFSEILPDEVLVQFEPRAIPTSHVDLLVDSFDVGASRYELWEHECSLSVVNELAPYRGTKALHSKLLPTQEDGIRYGFIWTSYAEPHDWSDYSSVNFWLRSETENWGIEVGIVDGDGDRFAYRVDTRPYLNTTDPTSGGWQFVSIPFEFFANPDWADTNDGILDLSKIRRWGMGIILYDHGKQDIWIDDFYLSRESPVD